jgi:anti-sigma regulatory factor (Ser/Thr protein kinase)
MTPAETRQHSISQHLDCISAQQSARQLALELGFAATASEEIVLAVAELATNLVRHAGGGLLALRPFSQGERVALEIETEDHGRGMADVEQCLTDGYSTIGSLGCGLGAVNRLMDELDITSAPGLGTRVLCRRWLRSTPKASLPSVWDVGAATRSLGMSMENGDAFVIKEWEGKLLAGIIDGLGHGPLAQKAAHAAQHYVQTHYDLPLEKIFLGVGRVCRATRGVVMALALFESPQRMKFSSIGNIEPRAFGPGKIQFMLQRGILGVSEPRITVQEHSWDPGRLLVLHSDGLRNHWQWSDFPGLEHEPAQAVAAKLLRGLAKHDDDATVIAMRSSRA